MDFKRIKSIIPTDESTWRNSALITFDTHWASDEILEYCLSILDQADISATFFVTHDTHMLDVMRANGKIELGIHPNYNPLLEGDFRYGHSAKVVLQYFIQIVQEAVCAKSHSMTQSSKILDNLSEAGIKFECNNFIPLGGAIEIRPWIHWNGSLCRVPCFWEDDVSCVAGWRDDIDSLLRSQGIKVFGFHPIHVFLNTDRLERYYRAKQYSHDFRSLKKFVNRDTYGVRDFFFDLIRKARGNVEES